MIEDLFRVSLSLYINSFKKSPFITVVVSIIAFSLMLSVTVLIAYLVRMGGSISGNSSNWGDFGSLLSGIFTFAGTSAAITTLILLVKQHGDQTELQAKQLQSFEFEMFDKHRKVFFEKIEAFESEYKNCYVRDKERLYDLLFPNNSPLRCDLKIDLDGTGHLPDVLNKLNLAKDIWLGNEDLDDDFWMLMYSLNKDLHVEEVGDNKPGDLVVYDNEKVGINIYEFTENSFRLYTILSSLLVFSGNKLMLTFNLCLCSLADFARLIRSRHRENADSSHFKILSGEKKLMVCEILYLKIFDGQQKNDEGFMFQTQVKLFDMFCDEGRRTLMNDFTSTEALKISNSLHKDIAVWRESLTTEEYNEYSHLLSEIKGDYF